MTHCADTAPGYNAGVLVDGDANGRGTRGVELRNSGVRRRAEEDANANAMEVRCIKP
jgi:hypothetical protein